MHAVDSAKFRSDAAIIKLREAARNYFSLNPEIIIGINGSYARREATQGSDLDLFYLYTSTKPLELSLKEGFDQIVVGLGFRLPSTGGVFSGALSTAELMKNIGGMDDTNTSITRRLLLMLEGDWLYNKIEFDLLRQRLFERYVNDQIPDEKICLYLLNDIIRYWRTICVDYEHKITEDKKPRGIRLVKLRFSRLMLIFAGILAVAETHNISPVEKRKKLSEQLALPVIERVRKTAGKNSHKVIEYYNYFLGELDNEHVRKVLEQDNFEDSDEYQNLRRQSKFFKIALFELLDSKYPSTHPIHRALML